MEEEKSGMKNTVNFEEIRGQIAKYGQQINEYLGKIDANIDTYKFSVEKSAGGMTVDVAFRATIKMK
jgi:hypothetical protein